MKTGSSERLDLPLALVVGSGALGLAVARRLGVTHRIVLSSRSIGALEQRASGLRDEGLDVTELACDITDEASVATLLAAVSARGPLRTWVHVAALSPSMGDWRAILLANLVGTALMERAVVRVAGPGSVGVLVGSIAGHMATPLPAVLDVLDDPSRVGALDRLDELVDERTPLNAYRLSKFALKRRPITRAPEWGARGARIVSVSPGLIATPMGALEFENQPVKFDLLRATPLAREATIPEVVNAIEFLASPMASFITGTDLLIDGGLSAARADTPG